MSYKINFKRDECLGCGACSVCENWEMQNDGKVQPKESEVSELGCNQAAADVCPVKIISFESIN